MKKILFTLYLTLGFFSCQTEDIPVNNKTQVDITVCAYLVADNNLDGFLIKNIETMVKGLTRMNNPADLLIYWDGKSSVQEYNSPVLLRYHTNGRGNINGIDNLISGTLSEILSVAEIVQTYPEQNSTSLSVMGKVVKDMSGAAESEKIGLIAGSHGSAWTSSIYGHPTRSFGQDGSGANNTITVEDMAMALSFAGRKFDFIVFDACMMGTAEVCYALKDVASYLLVSVIDIPAEGLPYQDIMVDLYNGSVESYIRAAEKYITYYTFQRMQGRRVWGTISVIDCCQMKNLAGEIRNQLIPEADKIPELDIYSLQQYGMNPGAENFAYISVDMQQVIKSLNNGSVPWNFREQLEKTVLYTDFVETTADFHIDGDNYCGLGMYIPISERSEWNRWFRQTSWYSAAGWNEVHFPWADW